MVVRRETREQSDPYDVSLGKLTDYERQLKIDKDDLDNELIGQPGEYYRIAKEVALTVSWRDEAKMLRDEAYAEADVDVRADMEKTDTKIVEANVKAQCELDDDVKVAKRTYLKHVDLVKRWEALEEAIKGRGYALKDLVALHVSGWYQQEGSGGKVRTEAKERVADSNRRAMSEQRHRT